MSTDGTSSVHIPQLTQAPLAGPPLACPHTNRTLADRNLKESPTPLGFILAAPKKLTACCTLVRPHTLHYTPLSRPHATHIVLASFPVCCPHVAWFLLRCQELFFAWALHARAFIPGSIGKFFARHQPHSSSKLVLKILHPHFWGGGFPSSSRPSFLGDFPRFQVPRSFIRRSGLPGAYTAVCSAELRGCRLRGSPRLLDVPRFRL